MKLWGKRFGTYVYKNEDGSTINFRRLINRALLFPTFESSIDSSVDMLILLRRRLKKDSRL